MNVSHVATSCVVVAPEVTHVTYGALMALP